MASDKKKLITLKRSDGYDFVVEESVAVQSHIIRLLVEDDCADNTIPLPNVNTVTLAMIIEYCKKHADQTVDSNDLKKFDSEFIDRDQSVLLDLFLAANYLNIKDLVDAITDQVASMIRGKSPLEIRKIFHIKNDFTKEEEAEIRKENAWAFD